MATITDEILHFVESITSDGAYAASGKKDFILPKLSIKGFGELALPVTELQAQNLIKVAHKAPFGKGSQTIIDENVRSAWEIDADNLTFKNAKWEDWLEEVINEAKIQLGIEKKNISASLYKMLIYEKGNFFTWHKDSEKEKNMFATLSITLPSEHEGGELVVRFKDDETVIDSAELTKDSDFAYAAFYADCDHEVRPLLSGYRICLVYNLLQSGTSANLSAEAFTEQVDDLSLLLREWRNDLGEQMQAILLDHQYTPENFELENLKLSDRVRAQVLLKAAQKAGLYARLGLLTHYQMGELEAEYGGYGYYDEDDGIDDGEMGEVYEDETSIENWAEDEFPDFGTIKADEINILSKNGLQEDEPIEKEVEGYTGNEGMTVEYWYHHGAVFLWTEKAHKQFMANLKLPYRLQWLAYYADNHTTISNAKDFIRILLVNIDETDARNKWDKSDASGLANAWLVLNNVAAFEHDAQKLVFLFDRISLESWTKLMQKYPTRIFGRLFSQVLYVKNIDFTVHLTNLLLHLREQEIELPFVQQQIQALPTNLSELPQYLFLNQVFRKDEKEVAISLISSLLKMSELDFITEPWHTEIAKLLTELRTRVYVNEVLVSALLSNKKAKNTSLFQQIYNVCEDELVSRTAEKPQPLPNWTREVPDTKHSQAVWEMLAPFLRSPTEYIFNYTKNEADRGTVEYAIKNVTIDLEMQTIKQGRPYTLRIKKNNAAYNKSLKLWEIDCELLKELLKIAD